MTLNDVPADPDRIHVAVLSGLLTQVACARRRRASSSAPAAPGS